MRIILSIYLMMFSTFSAATTYYLSPDVKDFNGDGSYERPWPSLSDVIHKGMIHSYRWKAPFDWTKDENEKNEINKDGPIKGGDVLLLLPGNHGDIQINGYVNQKTIIVKSASPVRLATLGSVNLTSSVNWDFENVVVDYSLSQLEPDPKSICRYEVKGEDGRYRHPAGNIEYTGTSKTVGRIVGVYDHNWTGKSASIRIVNNIIRSVHDLDDWYPRDQHDELSPSNTKALKSRHWCTKSRTGIGISSRDSLVSGNIITNVYHGIQVTGANTAVVGNVIRNFAGDGIRGVSNNLKIEGNLVANAFDIDDNHDDGFQSWVHWYCIDSALGLRENDSTLCGDRKGNKTLYKSSVDSGYIWRKHVYNILLRNNQFYFDLDHPDRIMRSNFQGVGLFDGLYEGLVIENNLVSVAHYHGITVMGGSSALVRNNTVVDADVSDDIVPWIKVTKSKSGEYGSNVLVVNNIGLMSVGETDRMHSLYSNNFSVKPDEYDSVFVDVTKSDYRLVDGSIADGGGAIEFKHLGDSYIPEPLRFDIKGARRDPIKPDAGAYENSALQRIEH